MRYTKLGSLLSAGIVATLLAAGPAGAAPAGSAARAAMPHAAALMRSGPVGQRGPHASFNATPRGPANPGANFRTMRGPRTAQFNGTHWRDHNWNRDAWRDSRRFHRGPGIGITLGSYPYWNNGPYVYSDDYAYDDDYADSYAAAPVYQTAPGRDAAYCMQRFKSYDPASGTYLGYDGARHPCP